jgi:hypothetical protein
VSAFPLKRIALFAFVAMTYFVLLGRTLLLFCGVDCTLNVCDFLSGLLTLITCHQLDLLARLLISFCAVKKFDTVPIFVNVRKVLDGPVLFSFIAPQPPVDKFTNAPQYIG